MAYPLSARTTGELITAAIWNGDLKDSINELYTGAIRISGQTALDFIYASSTTQLGRLAAAAGKVPRVNEAGSAWEMADAAPVAINDPVQVGGTLFGFRY